MILFLILIFLIFPPGLSAYFDVSLTGRSDTSAADTLLFTWNNLDVVKPNYQDSLRIFYDLNGTPDDNLVGTHVYSQSYDADANITVHAVFPEGHYVWFAILAESSGVWAEAGRDSLYIQDMTYTAYPRVGGIWASQIDATNIDTIATFDLYLDNIDQLLVGSNKQVNRINRWATVRDYNPEIKVGSHELIDSWNIKDAISAYEGTGGDSVAAVYYDTLMTIMATDNVQPFYFTNILTLDNAPGTGGTILELTSPTSLTENYPIADSNNRYHLLAWNRGGNKAFEIMRLEQVWADSVEVARNKISSGGVLNLNGTGSLDTVYVINNAEIQGATDRKGNDATLLGLRADINLWNGEEPYETLARITGNVWKGITAADGDTMINIIMWDVFFTNHRSHSPAGSYNNQYTMDDSAQIYAVTALRTAWASVNIAGNYGMASMNGMEDSLVNHPNILESQFQGSSGSGRWTSAARDLAYERLAMWDACRYRYQMRSDNWPAYGASAQFGGNNIDMYRHQCALIHIFDGYSVMKKPWTTGRLWMDEFTVDSDGISAYDDSISTDRWWLGWPIEPVQNIIQSGSYPDTVTNGDFESVISRWTDSGAGITTARTARAAKNGSWGLEIQTNLNYAGFGTSNPAAHAFDEWAKYDLGNPGIDLVDSTSYTLKFWARVGGSNTTGKYASRLAWVKLASSDDLYSTAVHIPQTWKQFFLPVFIDTSRTGDDLTDVGIVFGLERVLLNDHADTLYIDDLALTQGAEFAGYYRRYDNGMIIASMAMESTTVQMPDAANTYIKIKADASKSWADAAHNDSSQVGTTLDLGPEDSYYLFGTPPSDDLAPDAVTGLDTTSVATTSAVFIFDQGDSTDIAGYVMTYLIGATAPTSRDQGITVTDSSSSKTDTTITATGLTAQTQYSFSCFAYDEMRNYSSTVAASKFTLTTDAPTDNIGPDAVTGVDSTAVGTNSINLIWDQADSADTGGYVVIYNLGTTRAGSRSAGTLGDSTSSKNDTTGTVSALTNNTQYTFTVFAYDDEGPLPNYSDTVGTSHFTVTTDNIGGGTLTLIISDRDGAVNTGRVYDTYLFGGSPSDTFGTQTTMLMKTDAGDSTFWRWPYIMFKLVGLIPSDVVIDSAKLDLVLTQDNQSGEDILLYRCNQAWADSGATWNSPHGDATTWQTDQAKGAVLDTIATPVGAGNMIWDVTSEVLKVTNALTTPKGYLNLTLRDDQLDGVNQFFGTEENTTPSNRPELRIYYHEQVIVSGESQQGFDLSSEIPAFFYKSPSK